MHQIGAINILKHECICILFIRNLIRHYWRSCPHSLWKCAFLWHSLYSCQYTAGRIFLYVFFLYVKELTLNNDFLSTRLNRSLVVYIKRSAVDVPTTQVPAEAVTQCTTSTSQRIVVGRCNCSCPQWHRVLSDVPLYGRPGSFFWSCTLKLFRNVFSDCNTGACWTGESHCRYWNCQK